MLRPCKGVPNRGGRNKGDSYVATDVREFLRGGMDAAIVEHKGKKPENVAAALAKYIKDNHELCAGIAACMRGGKVYLYRVEDA